MSIHKRIQALTNFILQLEQHNHIPEIKKQIETLKTALHTLKAFSNDRTILKTTLTVMKQTKDLIDKYGVQLNTAINNQGKENINEQHNQPFPDSILPDNNRESSNECTNSSNDELMNGGIDGRCDGGIGGGYGGRGGSTNECIEMGGVGVESHTKLYTENFSNLESPQNIQKKFTTEDLQSLPTHVILSLNDILTKFRRTRNESD